MKERPDIHDYIGYGLAAAILIPLGFWIKVTYQPQLAEWIRTFY